jgi:hypothetical protein
MNTRVLIGVLEEIPDNKTFILDTLANRMFELHHAMTKAAILDSIQRMMRTGLVPTLQEVSGLTKGNVFMFVKAAAPMLQKASAPALLQEPDYKGTIHERMAGVEANLKEVLAAQGRAGDSASKAMIACTRNAEAIERVESMLKRMLGKLGETV